MIYIYDILLNFKESFLDFYEWNLDDEIIIGVCLIEITVYTNVAYK